MANVSLIEQLDQAVQAILANRAATPRLADAGIAPLVRIASELRDLPRQEFKIRVRNELKAKASLASDSKPAEETETGPVNPVRGGFGTVTPYIVVREVQKVIDFVQTVFGAEGKIFGVGSEGGIHSEYRIGESMLMIGGGPRLSREPQPAALHIYVEDVDRVYEQAMRAGATSLQPPTDQVYGERSAAFLDAGGNHWYPATYKGTDYIPEGAQNLMPYLHPRGAAKQIDFLKQAFAAEEVMRHESPDGMIHHAKVRIGTSIVEMGEAHGQWQPMPAMFMLYVDDCDAWYARAMRARGAVSISEPADQPYGDRVGGVADPFGNVWYIGTHIKDFAEESESETVSERSSSMANVPRLFRVMLEVADLEKAVAFYSRLLDAEGRVLRGSRAYFDCGPVILAILDPTPGGIEPKPNSADVYFAVKNLEEVYARALALDCLSPEEVHGESAGKILTRPWGERSFYVLDPWNNGLCFVDEETLYTGS